LWASLHEDLVDLIGWRVLAGDLLDYVRFRAVCTNWRSRTKGPRGRDIVDTRFHPRRWMMLPEGNGLHPGHGKLRGYVRFFNLSTGRDHDTAIRLVHPFTGDIMDFPPLETLLNHVNVNPPVHEKLKWSYVRHVHAVSVSVDRDGVVTVMMSVSCVPYVAFANAGDHQWWVSKWCLHTNYNPIAFQGKIYTVFRSKPLDRVQIIQVDPPSRCIILPTEKLIAKFLASPSLHVDLVECNSELMVFTLSYGNLQYSLYRLCDLIMERIIPVTSIGDNTLFLSYNRKVCVNSKAFPTIMGDTIVFLHQDHLFLAQYHLGSGTVSEASDGCIVGGAVPRPTSIIHHIHTCCFPKYWLVCSCLVFNHLFVPSEKHFLVLSHFRLPVGTRGR
ncbi:hypothetical protein BAE44_0018394, partial [Dichanthelium oligosanthes]